MPVIISNEIDPEMELISPWFHRLSFFLGISMCLVNGLTEYILNQQIKPSFISILKQILKRNRSRILGLPDQEIDATP
jgi:hypothetical protein